MECALCFTGLKSLGQEREWVLFLFLSEVYVEGMGRICQSQLKYRHYD